MRVHSHEDVKGTVGVSRDKVLRLGLKRHEPAASANGRSQATEASLRAVGGDADPSCPAGPAVMDEHIELGVGIARHKIRGLGVEGHKPAVAANGRLGTGVISLRPLESKQWRWLYLHREDQFPARNIPSKAMPAGNIAITSFRSRTNLPVGGGGLIAKPNQ